MSENFNLNTALNLVNIVETRKINHTLASQELRQQVMAKSRADMLNLASRLDTCDEASGLAYMTAFHANLGINHSWHESWFSQEKATYDAYRTLIAKSARIVATFESNPANQPLIQGLRLAASAAYLGVIPTVAALAQRQASGRVSEVKGRIRRIAGKHHLNAPSRTVAEISILAAAGVTAAIAWYVAHGWWSLFAPAAVGVLVWFGAKLACRNLIQAQRDLAEARHQQALAETPTEFQDALRQILERADAVGTKVSAAYESIDEKAQETTHQFLDKVGNDRDRTLGCIVDALLDAGVHFGSEKRFPLARSTYQEICALEEEANRIDQLSARILANAAPATTAPARG